MNSLTIIRCFPIPLIRTHITKQMNYLLITPTVTLTEHPNPN